MRIYVHTYIDICMCIDIYVCVCVCVCVDVYVCVRACTHDTCILHFGKLILRALQLAI